MSISRRNFLGVATRCAATLWSFRSLALDMRSPLPERDFDCVLLDLNSGCVLRESLQGYQAALAGKHSLVPRANLNAVGHCLISIDPGFGAMDSATTAALSDLLEAGTHVLLESGAGFLSPAEFTVHQRMLHLHFAIALGRPVDLWARKSADDALPAYEGGRRPMKRLESRPSIPYVNYLWPSETKVRDFSRVIPVSASAGDVVGRVGAVPVALKKRVAKGTLIFLGSPLGPALHAGDREALSWLRSVTAL
jgi:hypothetical protein